MNILDQISSSISFVKDNSKYVKINYEEIDKQINNIDFSKISFWLSNNPYGILDLPYQDLFTFLLIFHAIGDYCFWGDPKWEITIDNKTLDGSYAIMYLIINKFKEDKSFKMTYKEFKEFLQGNVEIPLLKERYECLQEVYNYIAKHNFYEEIKNMNDDISLLNYLITNFSFFKDTSMYQNHEILFYKRAQLITSDILHIKKICGHEQVDYSHLLGCADYKIPQVMRCYGMLEFNSELANLVDNKKLILKDSEMEVEIRALTLEVIDYIYHKLDGKVSHMDINDLIWLMGQDKSKMTKYYHRTLTICY